MQPRLLLRHQRPVYLLRLETFQQSLREHKLESESESMVALLISRLSKLPLEAAT